MMETLINRRIFAAWLGLVALTSVIANHAFAEETLKIALVLPLTGPFTSTGKQILNGARLYMQQHGDTVAGRKIDLVVRDDAGVADQTKRIVQELLVQAKVEIVAGFGLTPTAFAAAPLATEAKVPMIVMGAATSSVTQKSPFIVRTSFAQGQSPAVLARWVATHGIKTIATLVSDFAPGHESEAVFTKNFELNGGKVIASIQIPLQNPDFAPFLQRAIDAKPEGLFVFVPAGQSVTPIRQFVERGLNKSGIQLFGAGDITDDEFLDAMGDSVLGVITAYHYSAAHPSALNKAYTTEMLKLNNGVRANFFSVGGYDGMHLVYAALEKTTGSSDGTALVDAMKGMSWESPRGPITIDPATRDIVQNIYIRKVERVDGALYNEEFEMTPAVKDPMKAEASTR
jgi:branched-chain amino acid transport system substrate-binding protein